MDESERPACGIDRHYSRLTDVANELNVALQALHRSLRSPAELPIQDATAVAAACARGVERLSMRLAGQAEWLRAQLEPQE